MNESAATRREAVRCGALAAVALAAAGLLRPAAAAAQAVEDEDLRDFLVEAIGLEQVTVLAYATAADASEDAEDRRTLERFRDQEQAHANALRAAIDEIGFDPPPAPDAPGDTAVFDDVAGLDGRAAKRLTARLGEVGDAKTPKDFLDLLSDLETEQLGYYTAEGPALDSADLATTAVEIAGCQAQHLVVLDEFAGRAPGAAVAAIGAIAARSGRDATGA